MQTHTCTTTHARINTKCIVLYCTFSEYNFIKLYFTIIGVSCTIVLYGTVEWRSRSWIEVLDDGVTSHHIMVHLLNMKTDLVVLNYIVPLLVSHVLYTEWIFGTGIALDNGFVLLIILD